MEISRTQISNITSIHPNVVNTTQSKQHNDNVVQPDVKNIKKEDVSDVQKKIDSVNQFLKSANTNVKFNLHEDLNEYYITIVDEETKEVIKEVPPKKLLDIYAAMINTVGLFIDKKI